MVARSGVKFGSVPIDEGKNKINKFGQTVFAGADEGDVYGNAVAVQDYPWPSSASVAALESDDAADDGDPVGDGARTVTIEGLDANYKLVTDTVTLNGVGSVNSTESFLRVNRAWVVTFGDTGSNKGTITITVDGGVVATIEPNQNQTEQCIYTVPAGQRLLMYMWGVSAQVGANKEVDCSLHQTPLGGAKRIADLLLHLRGGTNGSDHRLFPELAPKTFDEKTDIQVYAVASAGATIAAHFDGALVRRSYP